MLDPSRTTHRYTGGGAPLYLNIEIVENFKIDQINSARNA